MIRIIVIIAVIIAKFIIIINFIYTYGELGKIPKDWKDDNRDDVDGAGKGSNLF